MGARVRSVLLRDPISDLLTRIRNGYGLKRASIQHPYSRLAAAVVSALIRHRYIQDMHIVPPKSPRDPQFDTMQVHLRYDKYGNPAIKTIKRISKPSRRIFRGIAELPRPSAGLGSFILSTPQGVLHCAEAREKRVGGEVLAEIL